MHADKLAASSRESKDDTLAAQLISTTISRAQNNEKLPRASYSIAGKQHWVFITYYRGARSHRQGCTFRHTFE